MIKISNVVVSLVICSFTASAFGQTATPRRDSLEQSQPDALANAMHMGPKAKTDLLHISVSLPFRNPEGMQAFVDSVSDPRNPNYRKYITPEEVGQRYGYSSSAIQSICDYLTSKGIKVRRVGKSHLSILADATVAQAQAAFNTSIEEFSAILPGKSTPTQVFSYTSQLSVPASIKPYVQYVGGLENFTRPKPMGSNSISPTNFRSFYNTASMYNAGSKGQGRTIGITNYDGYWLTSIAPWCTAWGLPTPSGGAGSNVTVEIPSGDPGGKNTTGGGEGDLDIQTVIGMAPLSHVIVYDGCINTASADPIGALTLESDDNTADIITESYGWYYQSGSTLFGSMHNLHLTMSAEGITYLCASGDYGTSGLIQLSGTPYPDIDPEILVVGGLTTDTNIVSGSGNSTVLSISSQVGWAGSGGGWAVTSDPFNVLPSYQKGTGVPTNVPYRLVPDVALNADPNTPFYIYLQAGEFGVSSAGLYDGIGGTSASTPTFAGSLADSEQLLISQGALSTDSHGHQRFGRINDLLYSLNGDSTVFNDITSGNNGTLPNGNTSNAGVGWDTVTGWGQMIFSGFVNKLANSHVPTAITISPSTVAGGNSSTATVRINAAAPTGGTSLQLASTSASATVPTTVVIPVGATTATFTVTTTTVTATQTASISASALSTSQGLVTVSTSLTINPVSNFSLSDNPTSVVGGTPSIATVTLSAPAPAGGAVLTLSSNNAAGTVPETVTIAGGQSSGTFRIKTVPVASTTSIKVTGTLNGSVNTVGLAIKTPNIIGLTLNPTTVTGGSSSTGTITLGGDAPAGGFTISLSSSSSSATVPASVKVPAGATSVTFKVSTSTVTNLATATITAMFNASVKTANLAIAP